MARLTTSQLYHSHTFQRLEVQISQSVLDQLVIDSTLSGHDYSRMQPELTIGRYFPPLFLAGGIIEDFRWPGLSRSSWL